MKEAVLDSVGEGRLPTSEDEVRWGKDVAAEGRENHTPGDPERAVPSASVEREKRRQEYLRDLVPAQHPACNVSTESIMCIRVIAMLFIDGTYTTQKTSTNKLNGWKR